MKCKLNFDATTACLVNQKPYTFMRTQTLRTLLTAGSIALALFSGPSKAAAQISVGPAGSAVNIFGTLPPATSWSTRSIPGTANDFQTATTLATLDAAVQTNTAALINAAVGNNAANPPGTAATAQWSSLGFYLQTRPTGNAATLLMASLTNTSGSSLTNIGLSYSLAVAVAATAEESPGHRVYYSLSGLASSWVALGNFYAAGNTNINISLASPWVGGSKMYILFADDNSVTNTDGAYQIDNFAVTIPFPGITTQPQDSSVSPGQNVTLTVVATGAQPLSYQWRKESNLIVNATNSSFTIVNAQPIDGGLYSVVVANVFGSVTSSNALVVVNCSTPTTFTVPPADQSVAPGATITVNALVAGTSPISYQWYRNGAILLGATNATYTKLNAVSSDSGLYTLAVDNCAVLPNSASAVVSVADNPYVIVGLTNHFWKYNQAGVCLDASWRTANYTNDAAWPQGRGLFAVEDNAALTPLTNTVLSLTDGGGNRVITYYFRTQFVLTNNPSEVQLVASNYVDDGAIFYVNGVEAIRINMAAGDPACTVTAPGTLTEAVFVVSNIPSSLLIQGTNTLAVEVHQVNNTSSDVDFGMQVNVNFYNPSLLAITSQPQNLVVEETKIADFTLGLQGQPAYYQWYKDGVAVSNATQNPLIIASATTNDVGSYFVVASNTVNSVTSSVVTLGVIVDTNRPLLVMADGTATNSQVLVGYSELVLASTATNAAYYKITNTLGGMLTVSSAVRVNGSNVLLTTTAPRLVNNNYVLIVNNVRDTSPATNLIAPNSMMPITMKVLTKALGGLNNPLAAWNVLDPFPPFDVIGPDLGTAWKDFSYPDEQYMSPGFGVFYVSPADNLPGPGGTPLSEAPSITSYFRGGFNLQASPGNLNFAVTHILDDGAVFWMNGSEFLRFNMPTGAINYLTLPSAVVGDSSRIGPISIALPSYQVGSNVIAVEVHQPQINDIDKEFGLQLDAFVESFTNGPVQVLNGPFDQTVVEGQSATFQVFSVAGVSYQWQTNNVNVAGAAAANYTIANVSTNMAGWQFRAIVSNPASGSATSIVARLYVITDSNAPVLLSGSLVSSTSIQLGFSKRMAATPAQLVVNYLVTNIVGGTFPVSSAVLNGSNVVLNFASPLPVGAYMVVVNNLTDASSRANPIAPNSSVTVGAVLQVASFTNAWKYLLVNTNEEIHASYFTPSFDDSTWSGPSNALFYVEGAPLPAAKNTPLALADGVGNRYNTFYFRQKYTAVIGGANTVLRLRHIVDDGLVLYLNGAEIYRFNMPAGQMTAASQGIAAVGDAVIVGPVDLIVTLLPGTNVFAAEVHQSGAASSDVVFGLEMTATVASGPLPTPIPVRIVEHPRSRTNGVASTAFFRSTATGTLPITLQWYKNGAILSGETNSLLVIPNLTTANISNYVMRANNSFSSATSSVAVLTVTNGGVICTNIAWQTGFKLGTNGLRTSITYSNGTTRGVLNWSNPVINTCGSNATVILRRSIGLRSPAASTLWTNVYTNFFGSVTVTNSLAGTNTVFYELMVP